MDKAAQGMSDLIQRDLAHIWHPASQMKDYAEIAPLMITGAHGSYLECANGKQLIDAISSWWCKSLGHGHPRIKNALINQAQKFEHVMLAHATHQPIIELSEKLAGLTKTLNKVTYASDGACSVEIAMKMSLHARQLLGQAQKTKFAALNNSYHGETCGALAVSDLGLYRKPYEAILPQVIFIENIPYISGQNDPLWQDCSDYWPAIEKQLNQNAGQLTALLVEPILQGAGGMMVYSQDLLRRLRHWCSANNVHLIADEILTGLGRTGLPLACQHAEIEPDFVCLGKGLTAGWLPFSAVLTSREIYDLFYDDYELGKSFLHSHTYAGNPLGAAIALETLRVIEDEQIYVKAKALQNDLMLMMQEVADATGKLQRVRGIGGMVAADLQADSNERLGWRVYQNALELGAVVRPLGNTLYWLPPLNTKLQTLHELTEITIAAIRNSS